MTAHTPPAWAVASLAAAYTKALLASPQSTVFDNIEEALAACPNISRACEMHAELVFALHKLRDCLTQNNLVSNATDLQRRAFITNFVDCWNSIVVPILAKAEGTANG